MAQARRDPWAEFEEVTAPAEQPPGSPIRQIVPPSASPPASARPDQARGEAAGATVSEYEARTRPERDAATDRRAEQGQRFTQQQQVLTAFRADPEVRRFNEMRSAYLGLRNLQRNPDGVNAVATIFAFVKALDPGAAVQRSDAEQAQNTAGAMTTITNAYNSALSGNGLSDEQRRDMVEAAADLLEGQARSYNEAAFRTREQLRGLGVPYTDLVTQLPLSDANGAGGRELENRQRHEYGIRALPLQPDELVNAPNTDAARWRTGIPQGNLPEGYQVEFGMDDLDPSRLIASLTGTSPDAQHDVQFTDNDLMAMEAWIRAAPPGATGADFDAFIASLPPNPNWQGPHRIANSQQLLDDWRNQGHMFEGQTRIPGPDISQARGQGGLIEGADTAVRGVADTATLGTSDEISALGDTLFSGGTYADNLRRQRAVDDYDSQNHFYLRTGGQLVGAFALPTRVTEFGRQAAHQAIRSGLGRTEAIQMARAAMGRRMALEGGVYGGGYGAGSSEGDLLDRAAHGAVDSAIGAVSGRALPALGAFDRASGVPRRPPRVREPLVDTETGRLNAPLEGASPAERVQQAQDYGIDLPLGAATDRGGAIIEKGLDNYPFSAGVMNDARQAVGRQAEAAVENVASGYGTARGLNEGGTELQNSARSWIERAQGARRNPEDHGVIGKAYDAIPIPPHTTASTSNTLSNLREINQRFSSNPALAAELRNPVLQRYQQALENGTISWEDLKNFRSIVGERIGERRFDEGIGLGEYRRLYAALSEDMRATAAAVGPDALRRFERANSLNAAVEERIQNGLTQILGRDGQMRPEQAARRVQEIIRSGAASSDLRLLSNIRASTVKAGGWNDIAGTVVRLMGQPANSAGRGFDPSVFVRSYSDMSDAARNLLFGSLRNGRGQTNELRRALDGFVEVSQRLANTNALRNTSNTGPALAGIGTVAGLGTNPLHLAMAGMGAFGLSKLWTNPAFVRWATGYNRMLAGAARAGREPTAENLSRQRDYLVRVARSAPAIAAEIGDVADRLFPQAPEIRSEDRQR